MKKRIIGILTAALLAFTLAACGNQNGTSSVIEAQKAANDTAKESKQATDSNSHADEAVTDSKTGDESKSADNKKLSIVTTVFPQYDWVREVMGERFQSADVTLLADNGVDLHSYQPSTEDMVKIAGADMLIYIGGLSDAWVTDALKNASNKDMVVINLVDILGDDAKEEKLVEGMEDDEDDHDHDAETDDNHEDDTDNHEIEIDEHVWLSLSNAEKFTNAIAEGLEKLDQANADTYKANAKSYIEKLDVLDSDFRSKLENKQNDTLIVADRFPFRYLVDDYDIKYYAAFAGCSAETEASFHTIVFLADKMNELGLKYVCAIETSDQSIAKTVIGNTKDKNQTIEVLNSMQNVSMEDINNGDTYLGMMQSNLDVLLKVLK